MADGAGRVVFAQYKEKLQAGGFTANLSKTLAHSMIRVFIEKSKDSDETPSPINVMDGVNYDQPFELSKPNVFTPADPNLMHNFVLEYLKCVGGWPVSRCKDTDAYLGKHTRTPSSQAAVKSNGAFVDAPACLPDWSAEEQSKCGNESWIIAVRKNSKTIGPQSWGTVGAPHILYSAETDWWVTLIRAAEFIERGISLPDFENFLDTAKGEELLAEKGPAKTIYLKKEQALYMPGGWVPIIYFYHQDTKTPNTIGFAMLIPILSSKLMEGEDEKAIQALATWSHSWISTQTKDMYKNRCERAKEFWVACGATIK